MRNSSNCNISINLNTDKPKYFKSRTISLLESNNSNNSDKKISKTNSNMTRKSNDNITRKSNFKEKIETYNINNNQNAFKLDLSSKDNNLINKLIEDQDKLY